MPVVPAEPPTLAHPHQEIPEHQRDPIVVADRARDLPMSGIMADENKQLEDERQKYGIQELHPQHVYQHEQRCAYREQAQSQHDLEAVVDGPPVQQPSLLDQPPQFSVGAPRRTSCACLRIRPRPRSASYVNARMPVHLLPGTCHTDYLLRIPPANDAA